MQNPDRNKLSESTESTELGEINRETSLRKANEKDDSTAEFGQKIGRSENLNEPNQRGRDEENPGGTGDSKGQH